MKRFRWIMGLIFAILLSIMLFLWQKVSRQASEIIKEPRNRPYGSVTSKSKEITSTEGSSQTHLGSLPKVEMKSVKYEIDFVAWARERANPPFKFIGGAGTGRIVDKKGNIVMNTGSEIRIFGAKCSPDKMFVLVEGGDAINLILEPSTGKKIKLPQYPPGENMLGLGYWHWISPNTLFGASGVQAFKADGKPMACCEGHNVAETKFYTFDIRNEQLSEVVMPEALKHPVVETPEIMSDGHIHIFYAHPPEGVESEVGWFKINTEN